MEISKEKMEQYKYVVIIAKKVISVEDGLIECPDNPFYTAAREAMLSELRIAVNTVENG